MRKNCRDLSLQERQDIYKLRSEGLGIREIGRKIKRNCSTVSRELKRVSNHRSWARMAWYERAKLAHDGAKSRRGGKRHRVFKLKNQHISNYVYEKLKIGWSPEIISLRIRVDMAGQTISSETIYQYIYRADRELIKYLVRKGKSRRVRGGNRAQKRRTHCATSKRSIETRPQTVELRQEFGHLESDLIVSCNKGTKCLQVTIERCSRYLWLRLLSDRKAATVKRSQLRCILDIPDEHRLTLTVDNGSEHAFLPELEKIFSKRGFMLYYCHPYSAWERGSVEAINGIIRRHFPKGTNFDKIDEEAVKRVENWYNDRPSPVINGLTPRECYNSMVSTKVAA